MNITEAKARRAAGKTIRQFEAQVAHKRDRLNTLVFKDYLDPIGRLDVTDISLTIIDHRSVGSGCWLVTVTAVVELSRFRYDEHLTDADVERVARTAFDAGRTYLVEEDFAAAVTETPAPDLAELRREIESVLNFIASDYSSFEVSVVIGALHEDVAALDFNIGPGADPEDFQFAPRAQERLDELHLGNFAAV